MTVSMSEWDCAEITDRWNNLETQETEEPSHHCSHSSNSTSGGIVTALQIVTLVMYLKR